MANHYSAEDVVKLGLGTPIVRMALELYNRDVLTWEQSLIAMVVHLAVAHEEITRRCMEAEASRQ